ncbi:hypothetical protein LENED_001054 [Lentinula edodes]|uniref:Transmembrane protein n=1 Tax=Lentinula edodes TaxID=5353 RepID=A0A1Q3DXW8_LENED|nr:hypothetical protein HHX47_DHR2000576 [Lentinula edodes]GAV99588.1 hypothetical protein LENED_001054 [Lentinula edodes]
MVATRRIPPPPLQLEDDNTRYGRQLLQSRVVEKDSFFAQVYETDWRKLIVIVASINLIRYFFSALLIAFSFNELEQVDNALHSRKRTAIFATVGLMYVSTGLVEIFGIVSTVMRRLRLIRIYVHLAFGSALAVTITGVLVAFAYFEFAEDVVNQCVSIANKGKIVVKLLYQRNADTLVNPAFSPEDAQRQCFNAWSSESSSQILYVFTFYFLPSAFTSLLVYTYYRQCTDPYHPATMCSQMAAESGGHPYTRVPAPDGYVSPYFSPLYLNVVVSQQRSSGANSGNSRAAADSRSSPGFSNRRRSALATNSTSGRRSARRARVNWFSKPRNYSKVSLNSSTLSASGLSPGPPSFNGGHLGYAYEMPYGQPLNSTKSEGKYA